MKKKQKQKYISSRINKKSNSADVASNTSVQIHTYYKNKHGDILHFLLLSMCEIKSLN